MNTSRFLRALLVALACVAVLPGAASAQSQIAGQVTDNTGGVLPGVIVEGASPALIGGVRTAVTDGAGQYTLVDLRAGTYAVTFTLPGFATVIRDEVDLPSEFTMTLNVEMRVGAIEESVTVSGQSPVVDVQQATRVQVLSREIMDSVPSGRTLQGRGQLIPGVKLSSPDVGGTRSMQQTYMSVHGSTASEVTVQLDGQMINGLQGDGSIQTYINDAISQEMTYQTSGVSGEVSGGGVRVNLIPRDGGNTFNGAFLAEGMNENWLGDSMVTGDWHDLDNDGVADNVSQDLADRGSTSLTNVHRIYEINGSLGGPIQQDKLWFFYAARRSVADNIVDNSFFENSFAQLPVRDLDLTRPGIDDNRQYSNSGRITYQVNQTNKIGVTMDKLIKERFHAHGSNDVVAQAAGHWESPNYATFAAKWTSTLSSRMLLEVGMSGNTENFTVTYLSDGAYPASLPGGLIRQPRPADVKTCASPPCQFVAGDNPQTGPWYALATRQDLTIGTRWIADSSETGTYPERLASKVDLSYVTGTHSFKFGWMNTWGDFRHTRTANADLEQEYRNEIPDRVTVRNTPLLSSETLNYTHALYAQDTWTIDRLTVSAAVRGEWLQEEIDPGGFAAGRFVQARSFPEASLPKIPRWFDVTPRFSASYDLFGDAKTAVKFSAGQYLDGQTTDLAGSRNPIRSQTRSADWFDCHFDPGTEVCSGADPFGTNGDNIAQDWEIGLFSSPFDFTTPTSTVDPDHERPGNWAFSAGIDHEVLPGMSVNFTWYRRQWFDLEETDQLTMTLADWTRYDFPNPLNNFVPIPGSGVDQDGLAALGFTDTLVIYNRDPASRGRTPNNVRGQGNPDLRSSVYTGFEFGFNGRVFDGHIFGALTVERNVSKNCDDEDDANSLRFCDDTGVDQDTGRKLHEPFRNEFKLAGDYPLPYYDIQVAVALQSYTGSPINYTWSVPRSYFNDNTPAGVSRTQGITVDLLPNGLLYQERRTQVDFSVKKWFTVPGGLRWGIMFDIYNAFNIDNVLGQDNGFSGNPDVCSGAACATAGAGGTPLSGGFGGSIAEVGDPTSTFVPRFWKLGTRVQW